MNKPLLVAVPPLLAMLVSGCAGQLQVFNADQDPVVGVPFRTAQACDAGEDGVQFIVFDEYVNTQRGK